MLARIYRAQKDVLERTMKTGRTVMGNFVYAKVSQEVGPRSTFAVIVAKKIEKTSVGRHKIKRMVSECIEDVFIKSRKDFRKTVIFFVKKTGETVTFDALKRDIVDIAKKIG